MSTPKYTIMVHPVLKLENMEKILNDSNPSRSTSSEVSVDFSAESALTKYLRVNFTKWVPIFQGSGSVLGGGGGSTSTSTSENSDDNTTSAGTSTNRSSTSTTSTSDCFNGSSSSICFSASSGSTGGGVTESSENEVTSSTSLKCELKVESEEPIFVEEDPINRRRPISPYSSAVEDYKVIADTLEISDSSVLSPSVHVAPPAFKKRRLSPDEIVPDIPERYVEQLQYWPSQPTKPNAKKPKEEKAKAIHPPLTVIYAAEIERLKLINRDHVKMNCTLEKQNKSLKEYLHAAEDRVDNLDLQLSAQNEILKSQRRILQVLIKKFQFNHCFIEKAKFSPERIQELTQETLDHLVAPEHKDAAIEFLKARKDLFVSTGYWAWTRTYNTPKQSSTPESC